MECMKLSDIINRVRCVQRLYIYCTNGYDQNILIAKGTKDEILSDKDTVYDLFEYCQCEIEMISVAKDGALLVRFKCPHYNERLETQYPEDYVKKWSVTDIDSRPFVYSIEMEDWM